MNEAASSKVTYSVAAYGIPDFEREILTRIFSLSVNRPNSYRLAADGEPGRPDIMLVDRDNAGAVVQWQAALDAFGNGAVVPTVDVVRAPGPEFAFHVQRPFMATRVLGTLDRVVKRELGPDSAPKPGAAAAPPAAPPAAAGTETNPAPAPGPSDDKYRALVVDDSLAVRKQIGLALERLDVQPVFADSGEAAMELISRRSYDVMFLDVVMPGVDGYDVCKSIKRTKATRHMPVIMLTGKSSPFDRVKGKLSGCDAYLTKPVRLEDFDQTLKKFLKQPILTD